METRIAPFCSFLFFVTTLCSRSTARDTLTLSTPLLDADGATLISDGGRFALGFFSPLGSSNRYIGIWYHNINHNQTVVWVANRKHAITDRSGRLSLTGDRGLTVTDGNSIAVWSSHSATVLKSPVAQLLDSGNFVVSNGSSMAWQSFEFPTDTYIPSMKIGWDLTTGRSYNLTAWTSESDPAPSGYTMSIDQSGDPQLVITDGPRRHWRGGPWNGNRFSGAEGMQRDRAVGIGFNYTTNPHQVFFSLYLIDTSIIDRLVISTSGTLQHYMWIQDRQIWTFLGFVPRDECDSVARCGPNGVCHPDGSTMCTCLPGFASRNNSVELDGCVRITALDCVNGTDGFVNQSSVKLPDTSTAMVDWSMVSLEECRVRCLRNCSCTGYAQANVSDSGSGCVLWWTNLLDIKYYDGGTGQDLFVRVAAADLPSTGAKPGHRSPMVAVIVAPALAIILLAFIVYWICWRKKKHDIYFDDDAQEEDLDLPIYDLYTIAEATDNFSESNKLGQGGYGPGKLMDGQEIAVKRLSMTSTQGAHEFKNEVTVIAKLQHRNLVRLLGCCIEARERMLIYEKTLTTSKPSYTFTCRDSLLTNFADANESAVTLILQADKAKSGLLDWKTRYNIIVGIARGLLYLHHDSRLRIIHRDMKASNILLDEHMDPKISDFGMARTFRGDDIEANTMRIVGTYGYMSPEYAMNGMFSIKSDVFSFGILILEIISGRRNRGVYNSPFHMNLLSDVWNLWEDGEALKLVDESIAHSFVATEESRQKIMLGRTIAAEASALATRLFQP
ncbi:hypothetical protein ZIOFF_021331 [Zingiber officinale]|uniref:Receptor-like serine/threonine-protein kinase n=1 Tax=Zingiber officinale TaxID=94328 RepID=A0A8J5HBM4_ZINOF|nr:hypothetical protein ZIOFF_021331 [Zingiber officinale]